MSNMLAYMNCLKYELQLVIRTPFHHLTFYYSFLRAEARISYGNSVSLSVCLSVTTRWYTKPR